MPRGLPFYENQKVKPKRLLLVYFDQIEIRYTPLDLGYAATYLRRHIPKSAVKILSVRTGRRKNILDCTQTAHKIAGHEADIVIFFLDNVLWSGKFYEYVAAKIIAKVRKLQPNIQIGFQSYKIREQRSKEVMRKHTNLDFILRGEPEIPLLDFYKKTGNSSVRGITFRRGKRIIANPEPRLIDDLDKIPSPYLTGIFDNFIKSRLANQNSFSSFVATSRGCPFCCYFCFRSTKFSKVRRFSVSRVIAEMKYLQDKGIRKIFVLDDTFMSSLEYLNEFVRAYQKTFPKGNSPTLSVMCRVEFLTPQVIAQFAAINVNGIQIGLQSINPAIQHFSTRSENFDYETFRNVARECQKNKIKFKLDVIFGLPGDSLAYFAKTLDFAIALKPCFIRVQQLYLNPDTLFDLEQSKYKIKIGRKLPRNVPLVKSSQNWQPREIKKACEIALQAREKFKKIKFKIVSEYGYCFDK
jgi:radical SAM superfamily enzyme YgiQ (UPF0313 family)